MNEADLKIRLIIIPIFSPSLPSFSKDASRENVRFLPSTL
jgi:hypothetical protein